MMMMMMRLVIIVIIIIVITIINSSTAHCLALEILSLSRSCTQSVGILPREISPTQGLYLHTGQHKQNKSIQILMPRVGFELTI
jgi:hypothetical protein